MYFCVVICIVCFVTYSVSFLCICVLNYCHRVATQLQLNISYHIILYIISYHISYHITSYHIYHIIYHIISYHIISYHIISYHIISYHVIYTSLFILSHVYFSFSNTLIYWIRDSVDDVVTKLPGWQSRVAVWFCQRQENFSFSWVSIPDLRPRQPPCMRVPEARSIHGKSVWAHSIIQILHIRK
jgi:hypothetical protein